MVRRRVSEPADDPIACWLCNLTLAHTHTALLFFCVRLCISAYFTDWEKKEKKKTLLLN